MPMGLRLDRHGPYREGFVRVVRNGDEHLVDRLLQVAGEGAGRGIDEAEAPLLVVRVLHPDANLGQGVGAARNAAPDGKPPPDVRAVQDLDQVTLPRRAERLEPGVRVPVDRAFRPVPRRDCHSLRRRERLDRRRRRRDEFLGPGGRTGGGSGPEEPPCREADDEEERQHRGTAGAENLQKPQGRNPRGILPFRIPANADAPAGLDAFSEAAELVLQTQEKLVDRPGFARPRSAVQSSVKRSARDGRSGVPEQEGKRLGFERREIPKQDSDFLFGERLVRGAAVLRGRRRRFASRCGRLRRSVPANGNGEAAPLQLRAERLRARAVGLHDQNRPRGRSGISVPFVRHRGGGFYHNAAKTDCNICATNSGGYLATLAFLVAPCGRRHAGVRRALLDALILRPTWATSILKDYLLRGYALNERLVQIEDRMDRRLAEHGQRLDALEDRVDFFVRTQTPPLQGVFYDGQLWDARALVLKLVASAKRSLILIDNWATAEVLDLFAKKREGVDAAGQTPHLGFVAQHAAETVAVVIGRARG